MSVDHNWEERTPQIFNFLEAGDELEGLYIGADTIELRGSAVVRYAVRTDSGVVTFLGSVQLNPLMDRESVGTYLRIRYEGDVSTQNGQKMRTFKLWVDPATVEGVTTE